MEIEPYKRHPETGTILIQKLTQNERADLAKEVYDLHLKGYNQTEISRAMKVTNKSAGILIREHNHVLNMFNAEQRSISYHRKLKLYRQAEEILEEYEEESRYHSPLIIAKAFDVKKEVIAMIDKQFGLNEPEINVNVDGQTYRDILRQKGVLDDDVSPQDDVDIELGSEDHWEPGDDEA